MQERSTSTADPTTPDSTAVRVALWRALHVAVDAPPHVLEDELGLRLAAPADGWRDRPDMHPHGTARMRAEIVARARLVEDLVLAQAAEGVRQYVILGAGLDTFAQRHPEVAATLRVFEVDQPGTQAWKQQRLRELGFVIPDGLRFVPVNFETDDWRAGLAVAGFDAAAPAVLTSTGVSQYITKDATAGTLRQIAALAPGTTLVMTFMVPIELMDPDEQEMARWATSGARTSGTPFISFYAPDEVVALARACGFKAARHVSTAELTDRYFAGRSDGLKPASGEQLLVATV